MLQDVTSLHAASGSVAKQQDHQPSDFILSKSRMASKARVQITSIQFQPLQSHQCTTVRRTLAQGFEDILDDDICFESPGMGMRWL
jgi:hypothetical protein